MFAYAYVRYLEDKRCALVEVGDFRDFEKWGEDMDEKHLKATVHWVKWVFKDGTSEYFPAEILHLGASEAEVQKKVKRGRLRFRRVMLEDEEWDCEEEPPREKKRKKQKEAPKEGLLKLLEKKKQAMDAGSSRHDCDGKCLAVEQLQQMKELADRQKDEIRKLRKLNEAFQQKVITQMEEFIQNAKATVSVTQPAEMVPPTTPPPVQGHADLNGKMPLSHLPFGALLPCPKKHPKSQALNT
ncbi:uncharacterized protein LOC125939833 [Dermacentor silvarum]|uniref:uncharacterized protein LOC125939833 n=1 Tax=Dermacentor silvarum TaxID=543639 RepID=UPI0021019A10|nr:uncharacterized protein LOC125939833 [Dermacentor silvarum]